MSELDDQWLLRQVLNFLDKPVHHVKYMASIKERNKVFAVRGFTHDDFAELLTKVCNERKQAEQAPQEVTEPTQSNEVATVETKRTEPHRPLDADNKRQTNASGGKVRSGESQILKFADERK